MLVTGSDGFISHKSTLVCTLRTASVDKYYVWVEWVNSIWYRRYFRTDSPLIHRQQILLTASCISTRNYEITYNHKYLLPYSVALASLEFCYLSKTAIRDLGSASVHSTVQVPTFDSDRTSFSVKTSTQYG